MTERMFNITVTANYSDNTESSKTLPELYNLGALEELVADYANDPLLTSMVLTIVPQSPGSIPR
jgi:hypothetical protein